MQTPISTAKLMIADRSRCDLDCPTQLRLMISRDLAKSLPFLKFFASPDPGQRGSTMVVCHSRGWPASKFKYSISSQATYALFHEYNSY